MITRRKFILESGGLSAFLASGCLIADDARPRRSEESLRQELPCWERLEIDTTETKTFSVADEDEMMAIPHDQIYAGYEEHDDPDHPTWTGYIYKSDYSTANLLKAKVYNTVDTADKHYQEIISGFENPIEGETRGDQAKQDNRDGEAEFVFTVSNAVGRVKSYVPERAPEDPDERTYTPTLQVRSFGALLYDWWGGTGWFDGREGFCTDV